MYIVAKDNIKHINIFYKAIDMKSVTNIDNNSRN